MKKFIKVFTILATLATFSIHLSSSASTSPFFTNLKDNIYEKISRIKTEEIKINTEIEIEIDSESPIENNDLYGFTIPVGIWINVDIDSQTLSVMEGRETLLSTSCVTGTKGIYDTPLGTYAVIYKAKGQYLNGFNADGTSYQSWVDYWIPFYGGYGIHDASWRNDFGEDIYTYSGSHGCVNVPPLVAPEIYDLVDVGTPVYVH